MKAADLLHDHGIWLPTNHRAATIARRYRIPRVVSVRGMLEPWAFNHRRWKKRVAWRLYQHRDLVAATVLHVTSEAEAESVRRLGLRNPLAVIPNGVDMPGNVPSPGRNDIRSALFLSRIHPKKGLLNLIRAWAQVRPDGWELVLAGPNEGGHQGEVEEMVRTERLESQVRFLGTVADEDKWHVYRSADLFILPTFSENFGLVVAEALAANLPVITTKGAPWSALEVHRCGWWVDIGVEPLVAALSEAVGLSDVQRHSMGERGRRYVEEHLSWSTVANQMRAVYEWILDRGPMPDCVER